MGTGNLEKCDLELFRKRGTERFGLTKETLGSQVN